ncbi:hypothetical protein JOM56_007665 [Amanita muscaria]
MIELIGFVDREANPIATARRIGALTGNTNLVISLSPEACGPGLDALDVFEFVQWSLYRELFPNYVKGYVIDWDKIKAFLEITDHTDGRIDEAMVEIIGFVDRETNPIATARRIDAQTLYVLLGPEACGPDLNCASSPISVRALISCNFMVPDGLMLQNITVNCDNSAWENESVASETGYTATNIRRSHLLSLTVFKTVLYLPNGSSKAWSKIRYPSQQ